MSDETLSVNLQLVYMQLAYLRATKDRAGEVAVRALLAQADHDIDEDRIDKIVERQYKPRPRAGYYPTDAETLPEAYAVAMEDARGQDLRAAGARRWLAKLSIRHCQQLGVEKRDVMRFLYTLPSADGE